MVKEIGGFVFQSSEFYNIMKTVSRRETWLGRWIPVFYMP